MSSLNHFTRMPYRLISPGVPKWNPCKWGGALKKKHANGLFLSYLFPIPGKLMPNEFVAVDGQKQVSLQSLFSSNQFPLYKTYGEKFLILSSKILEKRERKKFNLIIVGFSPQSHDITLTVL